VRLSPHTAPRSIFLSRSTGRDRVAPRWLRLHSKSVSILHLRSLAFISLIDGAPVPRLPPFGVGIPRGMMALHSSSPLSPISPVMFSRCLSAGRIRFLGHLVLLGCCTVLADGLLIYRVSPYLPRSVPMGVSTFRSSEMRLGWVLSLLRGLGVLTWGYWRSSCTNAAMWSSHVLLTQIRPSLLLTVPAFKLTEPHREFTCVHPSNLPLARFAREQALLGHYP